MTTLRLTMRLPAGMVAHQGGWDEILLVAGPIAVIVGLLLLARKRVERSTDTAPRSTDDVTGH